MDSLPKVGLVHRSEVGVTVCSLYYPLQLFMSNGHSCFTQKYCVKKLLGVLNSPDTLLDSLQTDHGMKGGEVKVFFSGW